MSLGVKGKKQEETFHVLLHVVAFRAVGKKC